MQIGESILDYMDPAPYWLKYQSAHADAMTKIVMAWRKALVQSVPKTK